MPLFQFLNLAVIIWSFALIYLDIYFFQKWREQSNDSDRYLILFIVSLTLSFLGRFIISGLLVNFRTKFEKLPDLPENQELTLDDGSKLAYYTIGEPNLPTVIALHGWATDSNLWKFLMKSWRQDFRYVMIDLPGLGKSETPKRTDYSLNYYASVVAQVADKLSIQKFTLMGHSIGGMISLTFCKEYPEWLQSRLERMILLNTTYRNPVHTSLGKNILKYIQKPVLEPLLHIQILFWPFFQISNWLSYLNGSAHGLVRITSFAGSETWQQLDFATRFNAYESIAVVSVGDLAMFDYDVETYLPKIQIPTLVLGGHQDRLTQFHASQHIASLIPKAEIAEIQPAGHLSLVESAPKIAAEINSFLAKPV
ncbi:MAG: hypothetical protein OHK0017_03770 [Patescibacteria group bacterium]